MSWVTLIMSGMTAACATLALVNVLVWLRQRTAWSNLLFSAAAFGSAGMSYCELMMMRATTPDQFATALRWHHVPGYLLIVALMGFVMFYLKAGRPWLAGISCLLRTFVVVANFLMWPNFNYREMTGLGKVSFLGEQVSVGQGVANPWMIVAHLGLLFFVMFLVDAAITVTRQDGRRHQWVTVWSMAFFMLAGSILIVLGRWQLVQWPYAPSICFVGLVVMMGYETARESLRTARLTRGLRESELQMSLAPQAVNLGVWVRDFTRNEIWASDQWRKLFGFAPGERLDAEIIQQRLHPDDREAFRKVLARATRENGSYEAEYRVLLPDGKMRWIASRGRFEFNGSGKALRVRSVAADITARKKAEAEALQQRSELAHFSRVTMLGELSGSMAHELNQPLTAILSNAQSAQRFLAREDVDLNEVRDILRDIVEQDSRASEIIRRMRLLLKKGVVQQQPLDLNDVVQEVLKLIRSDLVNQSVSIQAELATDLPSVTGDRVQLQQVLLNLVMNACDAMSGNAPTDRRLLVRTELQADKNVLVSVADCGVGIAPDKLEQVFEPFFTTKSHGLGLGLSVCRTIITAHNGRLWAANSAQRGSEFSFALPILEEIKP
jgi:two-component system, LuxR family, sensor kinase FixL